MERLIYSKKRYLCLLFGFVRLATAERSETDLSTAKAAMRDRQRARSNYVVATTCHVAVRTRLVAGRTCLVAARTNLVGGTTCHVAGRTKHVATRTCHVASRTKHVAARTCFVVVATKPVATRTLSSFGLKTAPSPPCRTKILYPNHQEQNSLSAQDLSLLAALPSSLVSWSPRRPVSRTRLSFGLLSSLSLPLAFGPSPNLSCLLESKATQQGTYANPRTRHRLERRCNIWNQPELFGMHQNAKTAGYFQSAPGSNSST